MTGRRALAILCAGQLVLIAIVLIWKRFDGLDLDVYRLGTQAFFARGDPYGLLPPTHDGTLLPFTYPPFAAVIFAPLLAVSQPVGLSVISVLTVLALGAALTWCFAAIERRPHVLVLMVLVVQSVALVCEPLRATLGYGQVNVLLMLLVVADVLGPVQKRGYLIGIAAAVKLTPLAFLLFFLVRKDFRSAARAGAAFVVCALVAWVLAPGASVHYWTELVFSSTRIGDPGYLSNQSLHGTLVRLGLGQGWWLLAVVLVLALTALAVHHARHRVPALLACAVGALLVSPISWTHHWVWIAPVLGVLVWQRRWWAAVPATILFIASPLWYFSFWPLRESYVLAGLALLLLLGKPVHDVLDAGDERRDVVRVDRGEHADP